MLKFPTYNPRFERLSIYLRNFRIALLLLFTIIAIGIIGFKVIANYSLLDAFYMTVITLSTVGFGEVQELGANGRLFASFLIIFNLGIFAYAITNITSFIIEGNFQLLIKDYRVSQKINQLENHVIVCGLGRHGTQVIQELEKQRTPFVIIEKDEDKLDELRKDDKHLYIEGDATHDEMLEEAGIKRAKALIATLGEDADNVFIVLSARELNPQLRIISRAFSEKAASKLYRAGANYVVQPEHVGGFYMATMVEKPDVIEFISLVSKMGSAQVMFEEFDTREFKEEFHGKTIKEMNIRGLTGANIIGIHDVKGHYIINPSPDTFVRQKNKLVVLGNPSQMKRFKKIMLK